MKKFIATFGLLLVISAGFAQDASEIWSGRLNLNGQETDIVFTILKDGERYASLMDTPSTTIFDLITSSTTLNDSVLVIKIGPEGNEFRGRMVNAYTLSGNYIQRGKEQPLELQNRQAYREARKKARRSQNNFLPWQLS